LVRRRRRFAALHFAAQTGDAELVAALLAARADVHSKDVSGYKQRTPRCNAGQLQRRANAPQRGSSGA
jgi:ankyrin repeat protein